MTGVYGTVTVAGGLTDSQVAANVVGRGMSTAYPLCCVCMELAAQLEARDSVLELDWIPRDTNSEADALADGRTASFNPELRANVQEAFKGWIVRDKFLDEGGKFYQQAKSEKASNAWHPPKRLPVRAQKKLREREPW